MTAGKLPHQINAAGGQMRGVNIFDSPVILVDENTARLPSYYRAKAVAAAADYNESKRIARATISGPGAAVAGKLKTRAPVDTAEPVVQKFEADDGTWRRKSTSETTWSGWVKQTDTGNVAFAAIESAGEVNEDALPTDGLVRRNWTSYASIVQYRMVHARYDAGELAIEQAGNQVMFIDAARPGLAITAAAAAGEAIPVQQYGPLIDASWNWTPDAPIFMGTLGQLTQTIDTAWKAYIRVGTAIHADVMIVDVQPPIERRQANLAPMVIGDDTGVPRQANDTDIMNACHSLRPRAAPSAPASGWVLYCDSGDSNKLKAIASNGTIATIGTP
jgi:hypothetical protein